MGTQVFFELGTLYFFASSLIFGGSGRKMFNRVGNTASGGGGGEEGHGRVYMEHKLGGNM